MEKERVIMIMIKVVKNNLLDRYLTNIEIERADTDSHIQNLSLINTQRVNELF